MKVPHTLSGGLLVRQDYSEAVRFMFFHTDDIQWPYATHGGTAFVVRSNGRYFGLVCKHALGDFKWSQLAITDAKFGTRTAGVKAFVYASNPEGGAIDGDMLDLGVIEFSEDVDASFFGDSAYILEEKTICTSEAGDQLEVNGALKDLSTIGDEVITPVFARFEFVDVGPLHADPVLREARGTIDADGISRLTGLSGSPVFNATQKRLAGIVVRGHISNGAAIIKYVDASDVLQLVSAAANQEKSTYYEKTVKYPVPPQNPSD